MSETLRLLWTEKSGGPGKVLLWIVGIIVLALVLFALYIGYKVFAVGDQFTIL